MKLSISQNQLSFLLLGVLYTEMSLSKPLTLSRLNDLILGSFSLVQPSETLDHLIRYLGTWSGSELRI